jgi:ribosomal protein S18 acetylase RimI-like enzyme
VIATNETTTMTIRPILESDIESIFIIRDSVEENHLTREEAARLGFTPSSMKKMLQENCHGWLVKRNSIDAGFVVADKSIGKIHGLFIRPEFEGCGLGKELLIQAENWLFDQGLSEVWLTTTYNAELRAYSFYKHLGYRLDGKAPNNQIRFIKTLASK